MDFSPRPICQLQRRVRYPPRGYCALVRPRQRLCSLESIWSLTVDSRKAYVSNSPPSLSCLTTFWFRSWLREECSQVHSSPTYYVYSNFILSTSSVIIQDIKSMTNAGTAFLAYFYFDFKDTAKQDSRALLASLLVQLADQSDLFCDALSSLYSAHKRGSEQPTNDSLWNCLKYMLKTAGQAPIYLIIDALDECPNCSGLPSPREKLLDLVHELVRLRCPTLRLCITSRPEFDIRATLGPLATQQVSLHGENGQIQDIVDYIIHVVHSDRKMKKWRDEEKDMVIKKLAEKADGM